MTKHIHARYSEWDIDIFQCAADEVCVSTHRFIYQEPSGHAQFDIPVRESVGMQVKINDGSISAPNGSAAELIEYMDTSEGSAVAVEIFKKIIMGNDKLRARAI